MFNDAFIIPESRIRVMSWALPLSFAVHAVVVAALIVAPILRPGASPRFEVSGAFLAPAAAIPLPPPPPPPAGKAGKNRIGRIKPVQLRPPFSSGGLFAPVEVPVGIEDEQIPGFGIDGGVPGGVEGGIEGGIYGCVVGNILEAAVGDVLAPLPAGGDVKQPRLIKRIDPIYPDIARESRVEGIVVIEARTDVYGRVAGLRLLRSVPLLDEAALDAVRQWVYEPMIVNGRPRGVMFTVTVRFALE